MKLSENSTKTAIGAIFFSLIIFGAGFYYGNVHEQRNGNNAAAGMMLPQSANAENVDLELFWEAWDTLNEKFVSRTGTSTSGISTTDQERIYGAIKGMTDSLEDPYTVFLPPTEKEIFSGDIKGEFGGVGMEIGRRDKVLTVISPLKDSPAEGAGVKAGDIIVRIDGESTDGVSVQEAVQKIRGEKGTEVELTLLSEDDDTTHQVAIERGTIQLPTIETSQEGDTFVVALYNFSAQSPRLFREALEEFNDSGTEKLVVDLRGNAGGYLQAAVEVSSYFLEEGEVIVREDFGDREEAEVYRSKGYNLIDNDTEVAVLVNGGSASASEIVAGALRDNGVAELIGSQTFGKGSVQELVQLSEDTALKVTVARWLTPDGTSISEEGLTPDVEVEAEEGEEDVQLQRAVQSLGE